MVLREPEQINTLGHLTFGGCDTVELAKKYGTPLYVMDETIIRDVCCGFKKIFYELNLNGEVLFASKAFSAKAIYKIIASEGLGTDVVSGAELYTALQAGMPADKIYYHGNNKTTEEINMAIDANIGRIVVDSHEEIPILAEIAQKHQKVIEVLLRVKPGIEAHTHEYITTGTNDSKFGLGISDGEAMKAVDSILQYPSLKLVGIHAHIGSQIFAVEPFIKTTDVLTDFCLAVRDQYDYTMEEIDFGGGYGIWYTDNDTPLSPYEYVKAMAEDLIQQCEQKKFPLPRFVIEPGRAIVGMAGITLYTVGTIKHIPGIRTYVSVDGGMTDNPRYALYQAEYTAKLANKAREEATEVVTVAGRCCESGDVLIQNADLPECERGDVLAVFSTGAYNYSMASNYNRLPIPAVVLVKDGKSDIMVARQTYEQLLQNDRIPDWL